MLITGSGQRIALRQVGTTKVYEASDSSYLQLVDYGNTLVVRSTDGTQMSYAKLRDEWRCTQIEDRNGNLITIVNDWRGDIQNITDTLGRVISFNYDANVNLTSITQAGRPDPWVTFGWSTVTIAPPFSGLVGTRNGEVIPALASVNFADGSYDKFLYNPSAQVTQITHYVSDVSNPNHERSRTIFNYGAADDVTRLTNIHVAAENWTGINGVPTEVVTEFGIEGTAHTLKVVGDPNGTVYKESYGASWQRGLVVSAEVLALGATQKTTTTSWAKDANTSNSFPTNPRVIETNVIDSAGNHSRTTITYNTLALPSGASCSLPADVYEYEANATTVARRSHTDYNLEVPYLNARVIGLPQAKLLYEGASTLMARNTYIYDSGGDFLQGLPATPIQHDGNYSTDYLVGRGNLVSVLRWDVSYPNDSTKVLAAKIGYDIDGSVRFTRDALDHQTTINYTDAFSANGIGLDAPRSFATFAYPTTVTDADGYSSTLWYRYDFGAKTRTQGPPPVNQPNGIIQTFSYDEAGRGQRVTTVNTGAYTRYEYGPNYVHTYSTVNTLNQPDEAYSAQIFDGLGRVIASVRNHPTINGGGYSAVVTVYDLLGRAIRQSNPTDTSTAGQQWPATGDDAATGWIYTQQSYDWKGRPLLTTNPSITGNPNDTTTKEASYSACGCAGSETVTLEDEVGRTQKVYSDVLGRQWKAEILNTDATVYSSSVSVYNGRDQVIRVKQYSGAAPAEASSTNAAASCPTGSCQESVLGYDGYGRLKTKHVPEQQVDVNNSSSNDHTTWGYNPDGTIQTVTDARGAVATYTYNNNRRLVNLITYSAPAGITPTANVSLEYDAAGNRKSMTDGSGSQSYNYNQLSQLTSETRTFGVGSYTLSYDYNLAGELKKITDPTNSTINYGLDSAGRLNSVTGSDNLFAGVSTYAANFQYRAFDAVKSLTYGNSKTLAVGYDNRLAVSSYEVPGILKKSYQRNDDNSLQFTQDQVIANSKFDRSYTYDHLGRVTTALSGAEARGQSASDDRPYHETFGYDAMNHLTTRAARQWNRDIGSGTDAFVNNRNPSWSYDADGRLTFGSTGAYVYDAAGSTVSFGDASPNMTDQQFDGDGQRVKSTQRRYDDPTDQWVTDSVTYYLNSTVLGGQVVTELTAQGTKQRTYVYAGQTVLAWQSVAANGSQSVAWEHRDASGASFRMTDASGTFTGQSGELDPVGANAGLFKPLTWPPPRSTGQLISFRGFEDMDLAGGGCELDRVPVPCGMVTQGNSVACPNNDCSRYNPNLRNGHGGMEDFHAYADGRAFYLAAGWTWTGNQFHGPGAMTVSFIDNHVPADLGKEYNHLLPQNPAPNVNDLESRITKMVSNPDCAKFISDLINGTATAKNPAEFTDALIGFGKIKSFIYGDTIMKAYGFAGGTVHGSISGGDAQVELPTPGRFPVGLSRRGAAEYISDQGRINAETVLHEILHLAGKNVYDDFAYAKTVADMRGVKRLDYTGMAYRDAVRKASEYWNDALMGACGPKGPRYEQH